MDFNKLCGLECLGDDRGPKWILDHEMFVSRACKYSTLYPVGFNLCAGVSLSLPRQCLDTPLGNMRHVLCVALRRGATHLAQRELPMFLLCSHRYTDFRVLVLTLYAEHEARTRLANKLPLVHADEREQAKTNRHSSYRSPAYTHCGNTPCSKRSESHLISLESPSRLGHYTFFTRPSTLIRKSNTTGK